MDGHPDEARLEPLRHGVTLDDGPTRPAPARLRSPGVVELVLTEGRHRQVRRMLDAVRLPVRALEREAIGSLVLDVPTGAVRTVSDDEVRDLLGWTVRDGDPGQG